MTATNTNITICPGCDGTAFVVLGTLGRLTWLRCRACGLEVPTDSEFTEVDYEDAT
jgi:hypothetical protein